MSSQQSITYTFPTDHPIPQLRGVTVEGGRMLDMVIAGRPQRAVSFETLVDDKRVVARLATNPALAAQVERMEAAEAAWLNQPVNVARRQVSALFAAANRRRDEPGEYFPLLLAAEDAQRRWRAEYPEAAAEEERQRLLSKADDLDALAIGALTYDADGSLSREMQQERHDAWRAEAAALRQQAEGAPA